MSLYLRNLIASTIVLILFLSSAAAFIYLIYQKDTEDFLQKQLKDNLYALIASAKENKQGEIKMPSHLSNPELNRPGSNILASIKKKSESNTSTYLWLSKSHQNQKKRFEDYKKQISYLKQNELGEYVTLNKPNNFQQLSLNIAWENYQQEDVFYTLRVQISRKEVEQKLDSFKYHLALWLGGTGLILIIIQAIVLRWGLLPLQQASQEIDKIQMGQLQELSTNHPDEISALTKNINNLIAYSNNQLERYRNTLGDLSHSLKTPLAIIQGHLNSSDKNTILNNIQSIEEQIQSINSKIQYHLQRASIAGDKPLLVKTALLPIINKTLNALQKVYHDKSIVVDFKKPEQQILCYFEETDCLELLGNLLDNAFKYSSQFIKINIKLDETNSSNPKKIIIELINDAPNMTKDQLEQIVERGKRLDEKAEGQGIGLHLVSDILNFHHGSLNIENINQTICVSVTIPGEFITTPKLTSS